MNNEQKPISYGVPHKSENRYIVFLTWIVKKVKLTFISLALIGATHPVEIVLFDANHQYLLTLSQ